MYIWALLSTGLMAVLLTTQNMFTAAIGKRCDNAMIGSFVHHLMGTLFGILFISIFLSWESLHFSGIPLYLFCGGCLGSTVVSISNYSVPKIGIASTAVLFISGQIISALIINHYGFFEAALIICTPKKILGGILMVIGSYLIVHRKELLPSLEGRVVDATLIPPPPSLPLSAKGGSASG
ncbi:DMT family transporter [bacterium]|nr:DMT family transporter [bacterium]